MKKFIQYMACRMQDTVSSDSVCRGAVCSFVTRIRLIDYCQLPTTNRLLKNCLLLTAYFFLFIQLTYAQRYPVQVTQTITPPYSTKLSDYATASDVKFRLNLLLTDVVASNKQIRLKLHIKGNGFDIQSTDFVAGASQVILNGGVLQQFTNIDLAAYFQPNNLIGISPEQYNKPLPEGMYSFCWEVYDAYTNQQLNHPKAGCSNVYLLLNDPPFLNLPYRGDQIVAQDPMNIIFQWTPRHTNATNVSYEFELRELWDTQINPQAAFLASPNYYSETTYTTTLLYNIGKPTLLPNRRYGWRVKAKSTTGVSENSIFKNDGYSEIYYFTYTNACYPPTFVLSEVVAKDRIKLTWQGHPDHKKYHVQYKRADIPDAEWFEVYTYNTQAQISNLRAGKTYMFRVGGSCNELTDFDQSYSYSHLSQFTMPAKDEMGSSYNCGIIPEIQIDNNDPLKNIGINETFTAGDFPVTVKQVQGGNGTFTGVGYIVVPYLGDTKIAVTFDAISINTDYQLIEGVVKTTYDPTWGDVEDTNDWTQGGTGNSESTEVDFPVSDVQIDPNGDILVIGENGEVVELPGGEDIVITDSNGQVWAVDEEGNITPQGAQAEGGASNPENTNGVNNNGQATAISAKGVIVTFKKASNSKYGFDGYEKNYSATKGLYKKLGNNYYVPYKAVAKNDTETIVANVAITDSKIEPQDIVFKTKDGVAITKIDSTATSYTLQLKGIFDDAEIETQALVKQGTKYEVAGAFIQYQATPKNVNVVLVNTADTNTDKIKEELQNIYQQVMVNLTITEINDFKKDLEVLTPNGTIQSGESGFAAQYTEQQRQINSKLKQHSQYQQDAYYLIVTDKTPSSANEKGLMPLGRQFGYIYTANAPPSGVGGLAAHELGHGVFQLKHPFSSQSYQYAQKATNWLLDYKDGTKLPFVHWQAIHNPKLRIGVFDGNSEGESTVLSSLPEEFLNDDKSTYTFMTLNGSYITLPKNVKKLTFSTGLDFLDKYIDYPAGALIGFTIKEGKKEIRYTAKVDRKDKFPSDLVKEDLTFTYKGFINLTDGALYLATNRSKKTGNIICLIPYYSSSSTSAEGKLMLQRKRNLNISFKENTTFNLIKDYRFIKDLYKPVDDDNLSKEYNYNSEEFPHQYELQEGLMSQVLKNGSWSDKHGILIKYAILNNAQPEIFKKAVKNVFGKDYEEALRNASYVDLVDNYIPVINNLKDQNLELLEEFTKEVNASNIFSKQFSNVYRILEKLSSEQISNINFEDRKKAFEILLNQEHAKLIKETLLPTLNKNPDKYENQILRLSKFIATNDIDRFLKYLREDRINGNRHLWHFAFHKLDNSLLGFNKDNRSNFIKILTKHYYKSTYFKNAVIKHEKIKKSPTKKDHIYLKERQITSNYKNIYQRIWASATLTHPLLNRFFDPKEMYLKYNADYVKNNGKIEVEKKEAFGFFSSHLHKFELEPFDLIYYKNISSIGALRDYNTKELKPLPALVLYFDDDQQGATTTGDAVQLAFDVGTLVIPGGQFAKLKDVGKLIYILDKASSVTSIAGSALQEYDKETASVLNTISTALGLVDMANLAKNGIKKNFRSISDSKEGYDKALDIIDKNADKLAKLPKKAKQELSNALYAEQQILKDAKISGIDPEGLKKTLDKLNDGTKGLTDNLLESIKKNAQLSPEDIVALKKLSVDDLKLIDKVSKLKYRSGTVTFDMFEKTMQYNSTILERAKAYELWGEKKWGDLYNFFHKDPNKLINGGWPPFDGFVKIEGTLKGNEIIKGTNKFTEGKKFDGIFDRFQNPGQEKLGGSFACPVFKGEYEIDIPYTHDSRALLDDIEVGTVYLKFRIKDVTGLEFKYGDIIPWKNKKGINQQGMGKQIQVKGLKFHDKSFNDKYNLIQKSIYEGGGKWKNVFKDKSIRIDKVLDKIKNCD